MFRIPSKPAIPLLPGACDCHMHFFGSIERYAPAARRSYTPVPATPEDYRPVAAALGLSRVVVVQPHAYGTDNRCTLTGASAFGDAGRAVVVIGDDAGADALRDMHARGARGVRLNLLSAGGSDPKVAARTLTDVARRIRPLGWHVQVFVKARDIPFLEPAIAGAGVPVVFDHMSMPDLHRGIDETGFTLLLKTLAAGLCWVKLSGFFHIAEGNEGHERVEPFVRALVAANAENLLWGTDWPHVGRPPGYTGNDAPPAAFRNSDDGFDMAMILDWAGDAHIIRKILVDNPARLYGFV